MTVYREHSVAVVVPAYNEGELVGETLDSVPAFVDRIYAIDDGSTDDTWEVIRRRASAVTASRATPDGGVGDPRITPIKRSENAGRGSCVKLGYRRAMEEGYDLVAVMDGDGQMPPSVLPKLLDPLVEGWADYTKGDRLGSRRTLAGMSLWRAFGNGLLSLLTKAASGYWHTRDSQNGYTAITRETLEEIDVDGLYDGYGFLNDLLTTLNVHDRAVVSVPHEARYGDERSTIEYRTFVPRLSALLLRNFLWRVRRQYVDDGLHPTAALYGLGGTLAVGSLLPVLALAVGAADADVGLPLGVAALFSGAVLFLLGTVSDARANADLEGRLRRAGEGDPGVRGS